MILGTIPALGQSIKYEKLLKGQPTTFDTAVAIQINQYRAESKKMEIADKYIINMRYTIGKLEAENKVWQGLSAKYETTIKNQVETIDSKTKTIEVYQQDNYKLQKIIKQQYKWYNKKELWFSIGLAAGVAGSLLAF